MIINSKLPNVGTTIFTVMSALARQHNAINLSQGFPNFDPPEELRKLVFKHLQSSHNQYAPMSGLPMLNERLAQKIETLYGAAINPSKEITITAGATQAIFSAITAVVHPGDEVIVLEPAYDCYLPAIELCGGTSVLYQLQAPHFKPDWEKLKGLISDKTKLIIVNTPHNPTATVWTAEDWKALYQLIKDTQVLVLSDEVYEHLTYDDVGHQSILRFPEFWDRAMVTYSFGKTFHSTGWKLGYVVANEQLMTEFRKIHQFVVFSVNTPMQYAIADFMADPEVYLSLNDFYQQKRDFFANAISTSRFKLLPSKGTYFQVADYSAISDEPDTEFAKRLTSEFGVAAIPVSPFYGNGSQDKLVRFCFAKTNDILEKASEILCKI